MDDTYDDDTVRVYVGTDRSQLLAVSVLDHSIRRHTRRPVSVTPLLDLDLPEPKDPRQRARTGFSFARFAIPRLAGYRGQALYLDADMLVFKDVADLWTMPFDGAKVLIQSDVEQDATNTRKKAARHRRIKQTAVMLINCERCRWVPEEIIAGLEGRYTYEDLVYHLCILDESQIGYKIPPQWNSLERYTENTCLLHYTDMPTQPWVSLDNPNAHLWLDEVRLMLADGSLSWERIEEEVGLGYLRPSLLEELCLPAAGGPLPRDVRARLAETDRHAGFVPHRAFLQEIERRKSAVAAAAKKGGAEAAKPAVRSGWTDARPAGGPEALRRWWRRVIETLGAP